jgi:hypothetical protein
MCGKLSRLTKNAPIIAATNLYPPPDNIYLADAQPGTVIDVQLDSSYFQLLHVTVYIVPLLIAVLVQLLQI